MTLHSLTVEVPFPEGTVPVGLTTAAVVGSGATAEEDSMTVTLTVDNTVAEVVAETSGEIVVAGSGGSDSLAGGAVGVVSAGDIRVVSVTVGGCVDGLLVVTDCGAGAGTIVLATGFEAGVVGNPHLPPATLSVAP